MNNSPYQEGYIAGSEGISLTNNPYAVFEDMDRHFDWHDGFMDFLEDERRRAEQKAKLKDLKDRLVALVILSSVATIVTAAVIFAMRVWSIYALGR